MITINNLQIWDLTKNQAKVLRFFINNRHRNDLSYKKIKNEIKSKKSFYRVILQELIDKKFIFVLKDRRPITYYFNINSFKEKLQEKQNEYLKNRDNFELLLKKLKDENNPSNILKLAQAQLILTDEQLLILNILFSILDDKTSPNSMTLKQIGQKIKKDNTEPTIRYNLSILEQRGFIDRQKIGRTNFYKSKSLKSIIDSEWKFQENLWNEKKKIMEEMVQFFQRKPEKVPDKVKNFEILTKFEEIKKSIINLIKNAERVLILDLRCSFEGTNQVLQFLRDIFYALQDLLNKKEEIRIKFLLNIDDWLIHKLDNFFYEFITKIHPEKFEFRVPIKRGKREFNLIIDEKILFQMIGVYELNLNESGLIINNISTARQAELVFNQIWDNSLDVRDAILDYKINKDLEKAIKTSERKFPIKYHFTDKFITISGLKLGLKFYLYLFKNAKNEVLTVQGPIFKSNEGTLSVLEAFSQENFYEKLNTLVPKKIKEGVTFKWIRNNTFPHLTIYSKEELKRFFIDFILSMYPQFQMRQISFEQFQFAIIDQNILCLFEYSEHSKLTLINDNFLLKKYNSIFQRLWSDAYDIRVQWLTEISESLQEYVKSTFNRIEIQTPIPKDKIPVDLKLFLTKNSNLK